MRTLVINGRTRIIKEVNGRTRIVREILKESHPGYKKNCAHKMIENGTNIWTHKHIEFRRCAKNCGHWRRKTIYFDTDIHIIL